MMKTIRSLPGVGDERVGQKAVQGLTNRRRVLQLWDRATPDYPVLLQRWVEDEDDAGLSAFDAYSRR